jgi:L-aminopeptidase/D-esterase-like protein
MRRLYIFIFLVIITSLSVTAQNTKRARDYGIPFDGTPGKFNAITDVDSVTVGQVTLIEGDGPLVQGKGPVRTGVTAILPRGKTFARYTQTGTHSTVMVI